MFILASQSPRRKELMAKYISRDFKIVVSHLNEEEGHHLNPLDCVKTLAYQKGEIVHKKYPQDIVISADTIVIINDIMLNKPSDEEDAKKMLKILSNKTHKVITAYAIFKENLLIENEDISTVTFNDLSDKLIDEYVKTGSPLDKAGAYGLQDNKKFNIIKTTSGSVNNIIGFPVEKILMDLKNNKLID